MDQRAIDALRDVPVEAPGMVVDGDTVPARDGAALEVTSPIDGTRLAQIPDAGAADVEAACAAARAAFEDRRWAGMAPGARKKVLLRWADLIEASALELAVLGVRDNGTEIAMAIRAEPGSAAATIRWYAEAIDKVYGEIAPTAPGTLALIHRDPVGVVGAIVPWNFPMMIAAWKVAPALAAGNSVVVKPAETASLTVLRMGALALEAGVPPGVLNVVTGAGAVAGQALARSMEVDVLAFTGSGGTGARLMEYAARSNLKRVYLELGGKSPQVVFADADLEAAAAAVVGGIFRNAGQVCVAGSRLLVQREVAEAFAAAVAERAAALVVGDPLDLATQVGALNSEAHLARVLSALEGREGVVGGGRVRAETGGSYMAPAIAFAGADDALFQEEVFGPVLTVTPFEDEADAIRLANATPYGLAAGVWTGGLSRAHRMVAGIRAGVVHVNTYGGVDVTAPMGGMGRSGNGYDRSLHALDKFVNLKTAWIAL